LGRLGKFRQPSLAAISFCLSRSCPEKVKLSSNPHSNFGDPYERLRSSVLVTNLSSSEDDTEIHDGHKRVDDAYTPDDIQAGIADKHRENLDFLENQVREEKWTFEFSYTVPRLVQVIKKSTASKIDHRCLTPWIYRTLEIGLLDTIARVVGAPDDWHQQYSNRISQSQLVLRKLGILTRLDASRDEGVVESAFSSLVESIAIELNIYSLMAERNTRVIVGGILADEKYYIRSKTDVCFRINNGPYLICSEVKTIKTFPVGCMWHNECRGAQILAAMYGFDCPAFLVSQFHFKLFVQNTTRDGILTFPYNQDPNETNYHNSSLVGANNEELLQAITICLLSKKATEPSSPVLKMCDENFMPKPFYKSAEKQQITESLQEGPSESQIRTSRVISGYTSQGNPIYRQIRVLQRRQVEVIENEIARVDNQENLESSDAESEYDSLS
jgi:hypothetical protein